MASFAPPLQKPRTVPPPVAKKPAVWPGREGGMVQRQTAPRAWPILVAQAQPPAPDLIRQFTSFG